MARLQYGTGLRRSELIKLRIKDIELEKKQIFVRQGKGGKDRVVPLPQSIVLNVIKACRFSRLTQNITKRKVPRISAIQVASLRH